MTDLVTNNRNLTQPTVGGDSGTWGVVLNSGVMAQLDLILGATQAITMTSADVTLSVPQWNNIAINITGVLTGNHNLILPLNSNSATVSVGGIFVVANNTTGAFNVTVITSSSGSVGVTVPQGSRAFLYSDTLNVMNADDARLQFIEVSGNPNGSVAGVSGSVNNQPTVAWDYTNGILYFCTVTGTSTTAVWAAINVTTAGLPLPTPEGYLTPVSNTPIITSDSISATVVYYTPFVGTWAAIHNGTGIIPYQFSQMLLTLTSSQAASGIYDVFLAYNSGTPVIGTGPSWTSGSGGSVTAGSCARGTGTGGAAISRAIPSGLWVNTVSMSLIYNTGGGNNTITVSAGQGIYLGSLFIDGVAGQVTCHRSYGQSRKWGIWNPYNKNGIALQTGDPTTSWTYNSATTRPSNNSTANSFTTFTGLAEQSVLIDFTQSALASGQSNDNGNIGIGVNSTTAFTGKRGVIQNDTVAAAAMESDMLAKYIQSPILGTMVFTCLESSPSTASPTFFGTNASMVMVGAYQG